MAIMLFPLLPACQKDPLAEIEKGDWNKEKRLISIAFDKQAGDASININFDDISRGTVEVTIVNPDLARPLEIKAMEISYGAVSSVGAGDELKFDETTSTAEISVTSVSGQTRVYTVSVIPLIENLEGVWKINGFNIFGGTGPYYGGCDFVNLLNNDAWWDAASGPKAELDNTLEFSFEGVDSKGRTFGTCVNKAGDDGKYADFVWTGSVPEGLSVTDVNYNYRKIPSGTSSWTRDYSAGTITFHTEDGFSSVCSLEAAGTVEYWGRNLNIPDNAFKFMNLDKLGGWGPIYTEYDKIIYMPWDYYVQVKKL